MTLRQDVMNVAGWAKTSHIADHSGTCWLSVLCSWAKSQTASTPHCCSLSFFLSTNFPMWKFSQLSHCPSVKLNPSSPYGPSDPSGQTAELQSPTSGSSAVQCHVCVVCFIIELNVPPFFFLPPAVLSKAGKRQLVIADKCFMNFNRRQDY